MTHRSLLYINYCFEKINFTVVLCVHVIVLYLFYIKWWFTTYFHSTFKQRIAICMHMCIRGHQNWWWQKPAKQWTFGVALFITWLAIYWIAILFIGIIFFYWQVFFEMGLSNQWKTTQLTHFAYITTLYWLTNHGHNVSLVPSAFPVKDFVQLNVFVWIYTAFAHLLIGCAIWYPKTGNLRYSNLEWQRAGILYHSWCHCDWKVDIL